MVNVLAITSQVVYGHVGGQAAVLALQQMGHEVWHLPTVLREKLPAKVPSMSTISENMLIDFIFSRIIGNMKILRQGHIDAILEALDHFPIVAIIGARQVGKSTLARDVAALYELTHYFDLERPRDLARLDDAEAALEALAGLVILDEAQQMPELFPLLRFLADRPGTPTRFLILGSVSPNLRQQAA